MPWTAHVKRHLKSMGVLETIIEGNECTEQDKAKADVFLHKHIDEMLQFEYFNCDDPYVLWRDLQSRFDHQREVLLPTSRDEWNNLRFQDFKKVNEYTSALFRICSTLRICGQIVTEEDMLEKTFSTFHASNINLQQQYRLQRFRRYSDLNSFLLVAEKNNELCGSTNHWSKACRTAPHLCELYQASIKRQDKEVNHVDNFDDMNVELNAADFINDMEI
ncbi:hypothetical protein E3N88_29670 [Mikania micrantha]|uniref:Uncharacterized protein n=1 Tax=Mikania micrantha TaxID=192012 RepID=A0A5N6MLM7_9ASTR|nr:hypothetical protein E3N88_29670 [Mikania micrantha]